MIEECWSRWERATDRLDEATQEVEGALCESRAVQSRIWGQYTHLRGVWKYWRQKCEKSLRNFHILSHLA